MHNETKAMRIERNKLTAEYAQIGTAINAVGSEQYSKSIEVDNLARGSVDRAIGNATVLGYEQTLIELRRMQARVSVRITELDAKIVANECRADDLAYCGIMPY
jgi:hypothetical protein